MSTKDGKQFGQAMSSIAHGQAMLAAIRDYQKEVLDNESAVNKAAHQQIDVDELMDDPELEKLHAERIARLKEEAEKRVELSRQGHGTLEEITEGEFLEIVTKTERVVCHFFHADFERCKIMNKHLQQLARQYFDTRFIKLSAPDAPFFTVKLNVKLLPCVICFVNGVATGRVVGFDELGGMDDFETKRLERKLLAYGGIVTPVKREDDSDDDDKPINTSIRRGFAARTASDEDSDFSD